MTTRCISLLVGLLCCIASATAIAQTNLAINGRIYGIEWCFQSVPDCDGKARFVGTFIGRVGDFRNVTAGWSVALSHEQPLNYENQGVTNVLPGTGEWKLILSSDFGISGTIDSGTLTYHKGNNTFDVDLTLTTTQGDKANVDATLNHNDRPPTVTGKMTSQKDG